MEWRSIFRRRMDECWRRFFPALRSLSDLISERVKSGLAVAKARGKRLGRQAECDQNQTDFCLRWLR